MMTILFSVSFTSCIDNEVSPLVEAIYEAQADLIAAQANVQNAEASLLLAQAQAEQAQADYIAAQTAQVEVETAGMEADNAYEAAQREQYLLQLVAQTNLNVANAENALALAQVAFETQMAAAIAAMEAAGAELAVTYAGKYALAMADANNLMQQLLGAKANLASAELMQTGGVSWEYYLAQLEGQVAIKMAAKANLELAIADMEAYIADPSTPEAIISGLKAQNQAYHEAMDAKEIEMQVQYNKIMAIYQENGVRNEIDDRIFDSLDEHNYAVGEKNDRLAWISDAEDDIEGWELALTNYPAALAALQLTKDNATTAKNTAQSVYNAANSAQITANDAQIAADAALTFLEGELAQLYAALQTAANTLASEQATYDTGIVGATTANNTAIADVTAAEGALATAQSNYTYWKSVFEANPAGSTWFDEVTVLGTPTAGADGYPNTMIGNHNDAIATSYRRVLTWVEGPAGEFYPATYAATSVATIPADNLPAEDYEEFTTAAYPNGINTGTPTTIFYVEVENDDVSETNVNIFNAMVAALGDENIFDNPPVLGDSPYLTGDAYANLWDAQLAQLVTQDYLDNFGNDLAAAQADYDYWKNLYENELALLDAAQATLDAANATLVAANTALANALTALNLAITAELNAIAALNAFLVCDDECIQASIDAALLDIAAWTLYISNAQPIIDAKYAVVASLLDELTEAGVTYTFTVEADGTGTLVITNYGVLSSLYPDIHAAIIAEWQAYWVMEQELEALDNAHDLNANLISAYGWWADDLADLANELADLKDDLANVIYDIEVAEQALASAQVNEMAAEAYISYLEALVTTLEQRHANTLAIAAKYKALMDAALAS
jgi:hypothetical protein